MINLTKRALPNTVIVKGKAFSIYTDYRIWMRFEIELSNYKEGNEWDLRYLFKNEIPYELDLTGILEFAKPVNELPRSIGRQSHAIPLDYSIDGDLIYSAFMEQYGIDLINIPELHWHKFLALLNGLNDNVKLRQVMGYRCYEKDNRKDVDHYAELRAMWEIEPPLTEEEQEQMDEFDRIFGDI